MDFSQIKNLVFDLGGVIINIDMQLTYDAFSRIAGKELDETLRIFKEKAIFEKYELGMLTENEFRGYVRESLGNELSDEMIDEAWNALLLDLPAARIEFVKKLRNKYRLFLLSNTNDLHIRQVDEILCEACGHRSLHELFEKVYFSYEIGLNKPGVAIYHHVAEDQGLNPSETLLIDDTEPNIHGAREAGWHALHVKKPLTILELLANA